MAGTSIRTTINIGGHLDPSLQGAFSQINSYASKLAPAFSKIAQVAKGAAATIGVSVAAGVASFAQYDEALKKLQAQTGNYGSELSDVMKEVYSSNFGENWGDVADSIADVNRIVGGTKDELIEATENAISFRDVFGYEVGESTRAAAAMMKQFGINSTQAYNLMAQGEQQGLDYSNELLDSISEYSVQFAKFGFSAEDMFNIFNNGAKSGAWNLDKVGDAVKEFSIRAIDGSNTTIDGFTKLNLNADEMAKKFGAGGETARNAFIEVVSAIKNMDDPVQQSIVGVDLFGTMWEDLGPEVVTQLANIGEEFNKDADTMQQINKIKYTTFMGALTGIKRQIETALLPIGEALLPTMNEFANWFQNVGRFKIGSFADWLKAVLPGAVNTAKGAFLMFKPVFSFLISNIPILISLFAGLSGVFAGLKIASTIGKIIPIATKIFGVVSKIVFAFQAVAGGAATIGEAMTFLMGPVGWIIAAIGAVIAIVTALYMKCEGFRTFVNTAISSIVGWIQGSLVPAVQGIANSIMGFWNGVISPFINWLVSTFGPLFSTVFTAIGSYASSVFSGIGMFITGLLTEFQGIIDFITGVFTGNWTLAWQGVQAIFQGIFNQLVGIAKAPINAIISMVNGAISKINSLGSIKMPDALGGGEIGIHIPEVPQFADGGFTNQTSICGEDGPEAVIPLKRNNPRSLSLLEKTAGMIGAKGGSGSGVNQFIFSPTISGNVDQQSINALKQSFLDFRDMVLSVFEEEGRVEY